MVTKLDNLHSARLTWRKSSRSGINGECVELADLSGAIAVRDSKAGSGLVLCFGPGEWRDFVTAVRRGRFDLS